MSIPANGDSNLVAENNSSFKETNGEQSVGRAAKFGRLGCSARLDNPHWSKSNNSMVIVAAHTSCSQGLGYVKVEISRMVDGVALSQGNSALPKSVGKVSTATAELFCTDSKNYQYLAQSVHSDSNGAVISLSTTG